MGKRLTTVQFRIWEQVLSRNFVQFRSPTLLMRMEMSSYLIWSTSFQQSYAVDRFEKSTGKYFTYMLGLILRIYYCACLSLFYERLINTKLNPIFANSSANPNPIPSLPPVINAQLFAPYGTYLLCKSFGSQDKGDRILQANLSNLNNPTRNMKERIKTIQQFCCSGEVPDWMRSY